MNHIIYAHEHLTIDLAGAKNDPDCRLDNRTAALEELRTLSARGVEYIIDQTNRGMGRNPLYTQALATEAGIGVLHATGYYKEPFLPEECYNLTEKELASIMLGELQSGMDDTGIKASLIGEIGTSKDAIQPMEEKIFRAAGKVHAETGVPICTHTTLGRLGMEQITLLREFPVDLSRVVLSHIDLCGDIEEMTRLLDTGVNIAFDTIGKTAYQPDEARAKWLATLCRKGYTSQIVMSVDITRQSHYRAQGGPGYAHLLDSFVPLALEHGCTEQDITSIMVQNPARIYLS